MLRQITDRRAVAEIRRKRPTWRQIDPDCEVRTYIDDILVGHRGVASRTGTARGHLPFHDGVAVREVDIKPAGVGRVSVYPRCRQEKDQRPPPAFTLSDQL